MDVVILIGTSIFCLIGWFSTHLLLQNERDKNDILEMDNVGLEHYNTMLKNKLQKKKELLTIQDKLLEENNIKH